MYAALWRVLPGHAVLRIFILLLLAAGIVLVLFTWVFPWALPILNPVDGTVQE